MRATSLCILASGLVAACGDDAAKAPSGTSPATPAPASLLLLTLDTTNAGALDVYGKDRGVTPNLSALAAESQVFDAARTVAPLTLPSHASMLTGLVPPRHGLRDNGLGALPDEAVTLAEVASDAGYLTGAFVSAAVIDARFGTSQGFERFDAPDGTDGVDGNYMVERRADATVERATQWLRSRDPNTPFFLWVHVFDPHVPYDAPADVVQRVGGNLYLAEIASMDAALGPLLDALPPADECGVIVVADHGESLGRHGEPTHSLLVHDSTMHVPLFVRWPDGHGAGTRSDAPVSVCDVFPTALAAMGFADEYDHDGIDLREPPGPERCVYFESYSGFIAFGLAPLAGVADGRGKWIGGPGERYWPGAAPPVDTPKDAGVDAAGADVARYRAALESILARDSLAASSIEGDAGGDMRALGYAGSGTLEQALPSVLVDTGRTGVAEGLEDALATHEAIVVAGVGKTREAASLLRAILARNPANVTAAHMLGSLEIDEGRTDEAIRILERLESRGAAGPDSLSVLGRAYERAGRATDALRAFERALSARPGDAGLRAHVDRLRANR